MLKNTYFCNICGYQVGSFVETFKGFDGCPYCGSLGRQRAIKLIIEKHILKPDVTLPVEANCIEIGGQSKFLTKFFSQIIFSDLNPRESQKKLDLCNLPLASESIDYLFCLEVLEHISDEQKALQEIHRVLKAQGLAIITLPLYAASGSAIPPEQSSLPKFHIDHKGAWDCLCYRYHSAHSFYELAKNCLFKVGVEYFHYKNLGLFKEWVFILRKATSSI